jgi:hypothetical protein
MPRHVAAHPGIKNPEFFFWGAITTRHTTCRSSPPKFFWSPKTTSGGVAANTSRGSQALHGSYLRTLASLFMRTTRRTDPFKRPRSAASGICAKLQGVELAGKLLREIISQAWSVSVDGSCSGSALTKAQTDSIPFTSISPEPTIASYFVAF